MKNNKENKGNKTRLAKTILFFIAAYILMFLISKATPLKDWPIETFSITKTDYMIWLLPATGFFFSLIAIDWLDSFISKWKIGTSIAYPAMIIILGAAAYYVSLWFLFSNMEKLGGSGNFDFMQMFIDSHYIYFLLSAVLAWLSKCAMDYLEEKGI